MDDNREMEILKLIDSITQGTWIAGPSTSVLPGGVVAAPLGRVVCLMCDKDEDREFIAQSPKLVQELLGELLNLQNAVGDFLVAGRFDEEAIRKLALAIDIDLGKASGGSHASMSQPEDKS